MASFQIFLYEFRGKDIIIYKFVEGFSFISKLKSNFEHHDGNYSRIILNFDICDKKKIEILIKRKRIKIFL